MAYINHIVRKIINLRNQLHLKNKTFTLFSSNCNGGCICHDLGLQFRSPFINLYLNAEDYIKFLKNPEFYLEAPLEFTDNGEKPYPVGVLKDITLHFMHYHSPEDAEEAWNRRKKRIDWNNLFILWADKDGCTEELLQHFDALPYRNKAVFTHKPMPHIRSAVYIPGFEKDGEVGNCDAFINNFSGKKYFDYFDYVKWFNEGK